MEIPCRGCLLVPVCRHKSYHRLLTECSFVDNYILGSGLSITGRRDISYFLKTTLWRVKVIEVPDRSKRLFFEEDTCMI